MAKETAAAKGAKGTTSAKNTVAVSVKAIEIPKPIDPKDLGNEEKRGPGRPKSKKDPEPEYVKNEDGSLKLDDKGNPIVKTPEPKKKGRPIVPGSKRQQREHEKMLRIVKNGKLKKGRPKMDPEELERQRAEAKERKMAEYNAKIEELRKIEEEEREAIDMGNKALAEMGVDVVIESQAVSEEE